MKKYLVKYLVNSSGVMPNQAIDIDNNGKIFDIMPNGSGDADYYYAIPGFIDVHTNGLESFDMMAGDLGSFHNIARHHLLTGTTSFSGTFVTCPLSKLEKLLFNGKVFLNENISNWTDGVSARCLGFHLEGPWISELNAGAHDKNSIIPPDEKSHELITKYHNVINKVTMSCHDSLHMDFLKRLNSLNIVVSLGHDETKDTQALLAFENGVQSITHVYCVTSSFQKENGLKFLGSLEMALMTKGVSVEVIADDRHITKTFWDFICHNKSFEEIIIVSDSSHMAGFPNDSNKEYIFSGTKIIVDQDVAWLKDHSGFAGSTTSMYKNFKRLVQEWNCPIDEAVKMTSTNPAHQLGVQDELGCIQSGFLADVIFLNKELEIIQILKNGIEVIK